MVTWLDAALKQEKEKYRVRPVIPDMVPEYQTAQAWGYIVAGYFQLGESLKGLLQVRDKAVPKIHPLSTLFECLEERDREILRAYNSGYQGTIGEKRGAVPFDIDAGACIDDPDPVQCFDYRVPEM